MTARLQAVLSDETLVLEGIQPHIDAAAEQQPGLRTSLADLHPNLPLPGDNLFRRIFNFWHIDL